VGRDGYRTHDVWFMSPTPYPLTRPLQPSLTPMMTVIFGLLCAWEERSMKQSLICHYSQGLSKANRGKRDFYHGPSDLKRQSYVEVYYHKIRQLELRVLLKFTGPITNQFSIEAS
jgi:hypothetical protein